MNKCNDIYCQYRADYNIYKSDKIYKTRIKAIPIEHHYEENGEEPYIKYSCPICDNLGIKHQVHPWEDNCSICGINLDWSEKK